MFTRFISKYEFDPKIVIVVSIIAIVIVFTWSLYLENKHLNIRKCTRCNTYINSMFKHLANTDIIREFENVGRPIYDTSGEYKSDFLLAVHNRQLDMMNICFSGDYFCENFCKFVETNYPNVARKHLIKIINTYLSYREKMLHETFDRFIRRNSDIPLSVSEIKNIKKHNMVDVVGVYIIYNETKNKYYVSQSVNVFGKLVEHFDGTGHPEIYVDFKNNNDFSITVVKLNESGYDDLDILEQDLIIRYDSINSGYNAAYVHNNKNS